MSTSSTEMSILAHESRDSGSTERSLTYTPQNSGQSGLSLISDLCRAIQDGQCLGYLMDQRQKRHEIFPTSRSMLYADDKAKSTMTLKNLLEGDSMRFPRQKRVLVATILTSSLLQLLGTHWLRDEWSTKDVFFIRTNDTIHFDQPYVSQDFISTASPDELLSASTTETPPRIDLKTSLQCLGIVLFELCFGKPIEEWKYKVQLRPLNSGDQPNFEFRLAIVNKFHSEEIQAEDPSFAGPIDTCLHFHNPVGAQQRSLDEIVDEMYSSIAKPMHDEMMSKWKPINDLTYRL
jgi:hypothetical protein